MSQAVSPLRQLGRRVAVLPIVFYKYAISPLLPPACRFYPTCSAYAQEAIMTHGIVRGGLLSVWRLLRCHPWAHGGVDPVPPVSRSADVVPHRS